LIFEEVDEVLTSPIASERRKRSKALKEDEIIRWLEGIEGGGTGEGWFQVERA
jgi:hypothetical protein